MSQPTLPDPQTAFNTLFDRVHARAFFAKLASYGYQPESPAQAQHFLDLAGKLRIANQHEAATKAAAAVDPILEASNALSELLNGYGINTKAASVNGDAALHNAAAQLAADPEIYNATLSLKAAEAAQLAADAGIAA